LFIRKLFHLRDIHHEGNVILIRAWCEVSLYKISWETVIFS
jgi:hypothetical protein